MSGKEKLQAYLADPKNAENIKYLSTYNESTNMVKIINPNNNETKEITVDELQNFDFNAFDKAQVDSDIEMIEEIEEPVMEEVVEQTHTGPYTLLDLKTAIDAKDVAAIENMLATFAVNPQTGKVSIDRAIGIVNSNTIAKSIECINEHKNFSPNLVDYTVDGKMINENPAPANQLKEEVLKNGFNNILLFVDVAKLNGINYSEENIARARVLYTTSVEDGLNIKGLEIKEEPAIQEELPDNVIDFGEAKNELVERKNYELALKPDVRKAGFADIFILAVIVMVYAAIIVNLILKLK